MEAVMAEVKRGMDWKKLLGSISESVNDEMEFRHAYLMAENRILRQQIHGRVQLTDSERRELAELGAKLGQKVLAATATVATPDTILAWHRTFADQKVDPSTPLRLWAVPALTKSSKSWWCG
jgi:hypothetical protein